MNYILFKKKQNNKNYLVLAISNGYGKGYRNQVGIGYWEDLKEKYKLADIEDIKKHVKQIDVNWDKEKAKQKLFELIDNTSVKITYENLGLEAISTLIKKLNLFENLEESLSKHLEEVLEFIIVSKFFEPKNYMCKYKNKNDFLDNLSSKNNSIYTYLDSFITNKKIILSSIYNKLRDLNGENQGELYFNNTKIYFERVDNSLNTTKNLEYEDQEIFFSLITDSKGLPVYYKTFSNSINDKQLLKQLTNETNSIYKIEELPLINIQENNDVLLSNETQHLMRLIKSSLMIRPLFMEHNTQLEAYMLLSFLCISIIKYAILKLRKYYVIVNKDANITIDSFMDAMTNVISLKKEVDGKQISEITTALDNKNDALMNIYKDFLSWLEQT